MDIRHPYGGLQRHWRAVRMREFVRRFGVTDETRVLDVGGDSFNWRILAEREGVRPKVTILNVIPPDIADLPAHIRWVIADALSAPFPNNAFDVVFSNSVIEHLGTAAAQQQFAREISRMGQVYWVQTPNRWFPMEPHLICPFIHYLPRRMQRPLYPFTPWALLTPGVDAEAMDDQFETLRLLTKRDFIALFPSASILTERVAGLAKCFIATSATR
jgi:uncharacterized membrane protein